LFKIRSTLDSKMSNFKKPVAFKSSMQTIEAGCYDSENEEEKTENKDFELNSSKITKNFLRNQNKDPTVLNKIQETYQNLTYSKKIKIIPLEEVDEQSPAEVLNEEPNWNWHLDSSSSLFQGKMRNFDSEAWRVIKLENNLL